MTELEYYVIRVRGHLDPYWSDALGGLKITHTESGDTLLSGCLPDQGALHGVLGRIRDLGLPLLAVNRRDPGEE